MDAPEHRRWKIGTARHSVATASQRLSAAQLRSWQLASVFCGSTHCNRASHSQHVALCALHTVLHTGASLPVAVQDARRRHSRSVAGARLAHGSRVGSVGPVLSQTLQFGEHFGRDCRIWGNMGSIWGLLGGISRNFPEFLGEPHFGLRRPILNSLETEIRFKNK